ncbi:MAG: hypothetical protein JWP82_748 [Humibacillus sp.]|nr:hypothetical protein [Humibacillus sp.]
MPDMRTRTERTREARRRSAVLRLVGGTVAVGAALGLSTGVGAVGAAPAAKDTPHKSYVCKYVSKPGQSERLQTGQNPIYVDNHSLLDYDGTVTVGQSFKDGQRRSVVIVANTPKLDPEPSVADCPPVTPPTTTTTTTMPPTSTTTTTTMPPTTTITTTTMTTVPPTTTTTMPPTSTTTMPPTSTTTTMPPTTTTTMPPTTTTSMPPVTSVPSPSTYPMHPVKAGVDADTPTGGSGVSPLQAFLAAVVLLGAGIAARLRLPRVVRPGSDRPEA